MNVKWIKLSTQMFEDEKIKLIEQMPEADMILIIWIKLLSQAGKTNASGYIYLTREIPYTDEMLSTIFNRPINTVRLALQTFKSFGMIEIDEKDFISITNWEKHQNVAGLDKIREQNRLRKQKERDKKRLESSEGDSHVTVTPNHATDIELELEEELDIDKDIKNSPKQAYDETSQFYKLAVYFLEQIRINNPGHKKPNMQKWSDDIRKMIELDKRTSEQVQYLMQWVQQDDFEMANVLSPAKLRTRFDGLVMKVKQVKKSTAVAIPNYGKGVEGGKSNEQPANKNGNVRLFK